MSLREHAFSHNAGRDDNEFSVLGQLTYYNYGERRLSDTANRRAGLSGNMPIAITLGMFTMRVQF